MSAWFVVFFGEKWTNIPEEVEISKTARQLNCFYGLRKLGRQVSLQTMMDDDPTSQQLGQWNYSLDQQQQQQNTKNLDRRETGFVVFFISYILDL